MRLSPSRLLLTFLCFQLLTGCVKPSDVGSPMDGVVVANLVEGATVTLYELLSDGTAGRELGRAVTDADGSFTALLSPAPSGAVLAKATGGSYHEEAGGALVALGSREIAAVYPSVTVGQRLAITPLTHAAAAHAMTRLASTPGSSAAVAAETANSLIAASAGLTTITEPPANPDEAVGDGSSNAAKYALVLGGISQYAQSKGVRSLDVMDAYATDATDGFLNGQLGGQPIALGSTGNIANDYWSIGVGQSITAYLGANPSIFPPGTTPPVTVTNPGTTTPTTSMRTDTFPNAQPVSKLDILFVVDNSQTMSPRRTAIRNQLEDFFGILQSHNAVDFQAAVTTVDLFTDGCVLRDTVGDGSGTKVAKSSDPDPTGDIDTILSQLSDSGGTSFWEQGLECSRFAVKNDGTELVRDDTPLALVYLTDEEDYSCKQNCFGVQPEDNSGDVPWETSRYVDYFSALKKAENTFVKAYPIVSKNFDDCGVASLGTRYLAVADALAAAYHPGTKAVSGSICTGTPEETSPVAKAFRAVAQDLADSGLVYRLSAPYVGTAFAVTVDGTAVAPTNNWEYDAATGTVTFTGSYVPPTGSTVAITYSTTVPTAPTPTPTPTPTSTPLPTTKSDTFTSVRITTAVDLLLVVDNSLTMSPRRTALHNQVLSFVSLLQSRQAVDYQIAVTTVDRFTEACDLNDSNGWDFKMDKGSPVPRPEGDGGIRVVKSADALTWSNDPGDAGAPKSPVHTMKLTLSEIADVGDTSFWEQGLECSREAVATYGSEFMRSGTPLAVAYFTDEDDYSCKSGCFGVEPENNPDDVPWETNRYVDYFSELKKGEGSYVKMYPVVAKDLDDCVAPSLGTRYLTVADAVWQAYQLGDAALSGSICTSLPEEDSPVATAFRAIARDLADDGFVYTLSEPATAAGMTVRVNGNLIPPAGTWVFDAVKRTVTFTGAYAPPVGSTVVITYIPL